MPLQEGVKKRPESYPRLIILQRRFAPVIEEPEAFIVRQQCRRGLIEDSGRFCRHFAEQFIECLPTSMLNISPLSFQRLHLPFLFLLPPLFCLGGRLTLLLLNKFGIGVVLANGL